MDRAMDRPTENQAMVKILRAFPGTTLYRPLADLEVGRPGACTLCGMECTWRDTINRPWHVRCAAKVS